VAMPNQKFNILVVCTFNQWRSPTAEVIFKNDPRFNIRSAGVSASAKHQISHGDIEWADVIVVMEKEHKKKIERVFDRNHLPAIHILDIEKNYQFMEPELIELLEEKFATLLSQLSLPH
jgi:predicted protein tyrosine phosphatase